MKKPEEMSTPGKISLNPENFRWTKEEKGQGVFKDQIMDSEDPRLSAEYERDKSICNKINDGARFRVLLGLHPSVPGKERKFMILETLKTKGSEVWQGEEDGFASVLLDDGSRMPLWRLFAAMGEDLHEQTFVREIREDDDIPDFAKDYSVGGKGCSVEDLSKWFESKFGAQLIEVS